MQESVASEQATLTLGVNNRISNTDSPEHNSRGNQQSTDQFFHLVSFSLASGTQQ